MKKIMIALAAVATAIGVQAAAVTWTTPVLYAANADGSFNTGTKLKAATGVTDFMVTLAFYDSTEALMSTVTGTSSSSFTKAGAVTSATSDSFTIGSDYYYTASYTYTDKDGKTWTMDVDKTKFTFSTSTGNHALSVADAGAWTAAPEPTSGLLLLIGMAGLALRRRRA